MKLNNLSRQILKYMVSVYTSNNTVWFSFETIKENFNKYSDDTLSKAIYLLENDGFVIVSPADDVAYMTRLLPSGIRQYQENTILKKVYSFLKELKTLLG